MMASRTTIAIPGLVRIKSGALERLGVYFGRVRVCGTGGWLDGLMDGMREIKASCS
jgi:hypothetical protein